MLLAENGREAVAALEKGGIDLLVSDIRMPDMSGVDVLRRAKELDPDILGVMITAYASKETSVEALRLGASNYVEKGGPEFPAEVVEVVRKALEQRQIRRERRELQQENVLLKRTLGTSHTFSNIIGRSQGMLEIFKLIETVASTNSTVLVTGESGTGKELVARAIHFNSPQAGAAVRRPQLRRPAREPARVRAVRPHAGRVHRRGHEQEGAARGRRPGNGVPRRDRRDDADGAGQAAARDSGAALPAARRPG